MALFNADELLKSDVEPVTLQLGYIEEDGERLPVTITFDVSDKLREAYRKADAQYRYAPRYIFEKGSKVPVGSLANDPVQFCVELLKVGYKDSKNLIDNPSKKAVLAAVRKEISFAKTLAEKLVQFFENDSLFQEEEDELKN